VENKVIVLGMHRGGTSLTANLLHIYGIFGGDEESLLKGNDWNPRGYWEYIPLVNFNVDLLFSVGAKWHVPPTDEECVELERRSLESDYKDRALHLINAMQEKRCAWFWKDPRLALLLPFWKNLWGDAVYVISIRRPLDIALSLQKRDHFPISASLLIWQRHMLAILKGTETEQNKIFIDYEELVKDPAGQCERLYLFLSHYHRATASKRQVIENMVNTIDPKLHHNSKSSPLPNAAEATESQKALYDFLKRKVDNPFECGDQSIFTMYTGWRGYLLTLDTALQAWSQLPVKEKEALLSRLTTSYKEMFGL
jgi:hypothetical protein